MWDFDYARRVMLKRHLAARGIHDQRVLGAMGEIAREKFVEAGQEAFAYADAALPIASGQTISQPYIVALMLQAAELKPDDHSLEIGTGSGFAAVVMARLCRDVITFERHAPLAQSARQRLEAIGIDNVEIRVGDGSQGATDAAPFDAIIVAAGAPAIPPPLRDQLEIGGRLIVPVGAQDTEQRLIRITRITANAFEEEDLGGVLFVPLIGSAGWPDDVEPLPAKGTPPG